MNIEDLKSSISSVISADACSAEFFFLLDDGEGMKVKSVDIDDTDQTELEGMFLRSISDSILLNDDLTLVSLSSADDRKNALYKYDLEDIPDELAYLKTIIQEEQFDNFNLSDDDLSHLEGILILIGNQDTQLALYKHQYPVTLLKQDSGFNLMKPKGGNRFKKLDSDILKINSKFEFIKINGEYYILDIKALERFFGFHDAVKNVAEKGIENIKDANLVVNCEVFESRLDDISFARKLVKSASNSPVLGVIPNSQIISFTNTHPSLKGSFKYTEDGTKLNLKTKKSQNLFLKLLNDDFLQSELTKIFYDSIAKDSVDDEKESAA
ncbi:anti-phage protein KwaB [Motiliproteus sp.]|uniref:anti-phage protein KwaB n=1 Tax=Motiliproteus sp. TaxID=1898955 RepID=UPI003BA9589D